MVPCPLSSLADDVPETNVFCLYTFRSGCELNTTIQDSDIPIHTSSTISRYCRALITVYSIYSSWEYLRECLHLHVLFYICNIRISLNCFKHPSFGTFIENPLRTIIDITHLRLDVSSLRPLYSIGALGSLFFNTTIY